MMLKKIKLTSNIRSFLDFIAIDKLSSKFLTCISLCGMVKFKTESSHCDLLAANFKFKCLQIKFSL